MQFGTWYHIIFHNLGGGAKIFVPQAPDQDSLCCCISVNVGPKLTLLNF